MPVRRAAPDLCRPFRPGMAPDFLSVLDTVRAGYRAVCEPAARGFMTATKSQAIEFARKTRTFLRGVTALFGNAALLNPFRNPVFSFILVSHKLLRWLAPLALVGCLISAILLRDLPFYRTALYLQLLLFALAVAGLALPRVAASSSIIRLCAFFLLVNVAAAKALFLWLGGSAAGNLAADAEARVSHRNAPLRVLHLRDSPWIDGPGRTILETASSIDRTRIDYHVGAFINAPGASHPLVDALRKRGLAVHEVVDDGTSVKRIAEQVVALIDSLRIDILHTSEFRSTVIGLMCRRRRPVRLVSTAHGWIANDLRGKVKSCLDRVLRRRCDRVILVSHALRRQLPRWLVPDSRVRVVRNALVLERFAGRVTLADAARTGYQARCRAAECRKTFGGERPSAAVVRCRGPCAGISWTSRFIRRNRTAGIGSASASRVSSVLQSV